MVMARREKCIYSWKPFLYFISCFHIISIQTFLVFSEIYNGEAPTICLFVKSAANLAPSRLHRKAFIPPNIFSLSFHLKPENWHLIWGFPAVFRNLNSSQMWDYGWLLQNQFYLCVLNAIQSACVLEHLKMSAKCAVQRWRGVFAPLHPPWWELVISFQTQMILNVLSGEHCAASAAWPLFSAALYIWTYYDNRVRRNEKTQSMKRDFNMRLCAWGSWS